MTLERVDSGTLELGGCAIEVLRYRRTLERLPGAHPVSNSEELTFATALRATLASTLRVGDVELITTPAAICLNFKHME